jgi:flagellar motor protein MotB
MRRFRARAHEDTLWAPLADTMTLLASVFFVVMIAMFVASERSASVQRQKGARLERAEALIEQVQGQLKVLKNVDPGITVEGGVVRLPDSVLFGLNSAELSPEGRALLEKKIAPVLAGLGAKGPRIIVSGHADAKQVRDDPYRNWRLSALRAANVVVILLKAARLPQDRIVAIGYGDTRPRPGLDPTDDANRRVELSVSVEVSDLLSLEAP